MSFNCTLAKQNKLMALEQAITEMPNRVDMTSMTHHHFAPGVYARSLFIPEGVVLTGKIHRHELMNVLVYGTIRFTMGDATEEITGPLVFNSGRGSKKAIYGVTDALLMNIHPTELTDLEKIEAEFIAPSYEDLEELI